MQFQVNAAAIKDHVLLKLLTDAEAEQIKREEVYERAVAANDAAKKLVDDGAMACVTLRNEVMRRKGDPRDQPMTQDFGSERL